MRRQGFACCQLLRRLALDLLRLEDSFSKSSPSASSPCLHTISLSTLASFKSRSYKKESQSFFLCSEPSNMVEEDRAGITCFANPAPGFRGILKQRYSDFLVNEVDSEGKVVHLTCLDAPEEVLIGPDNCETKGGLEDTQGPGLDCLDVAKHIEAFKAIAGDGDAELLRGLLLKICEGEKEGCAPIVLAPDSDKANRTTIHNFFKSRLPILVTDTIDGNDSKSKCVRVRVLSNDSSGGRSSGKRIRDSRGKWEKSTRQKYNGQEFDRRGAESWPEERGKYLQFHLYKENKDTQDALMVLAKMLHVQPNSFGIAGTKDKRAITIQRVTAFKQAAFKLAALNKRLFGIKVGNFCYVEDRLVLGQLSGNMFTITLRGVVEENEEIIKKAADSFRKSGFINYFGLQRFGTSSVPTFTVGASLLRGEWEAAVNLILQPRDGERQDTIEAREYFLKTKDADGTLLRMPRQLFIERAILTGLRKHPGNYLQAIQSLPRTMRMLFVHSYQSYLWNHAASKRIQLYGVDNVVEGDLVLCKDAETDMSGTRREFLLEDNDGFNEAIDEGEIASDLVQTIDVLPLVKHATAEDVGCGKFSIKDVVLPLPGVKTLLPAHDAALVYEQLSKEDKLDLQSSSHNVKEFSFLHLRGGYRPIIQMARDFDWKILKYADASEPLAETDWERITKCNKKIKEEMIVQQELKQIDTGAESDLAEISGTSKGGSSAVTVSTCQTAVQLRFTLPSSCYATMAIREILKSSSSVAFHKNLNEGAS